MKLKQVGNAGVDVFLFISGISLYFSVSKGYTWKKFYVNRLKRLFLPTLFLTVPWFLYKNIIMAFRPRTFLLNVTGLSLFTAGDRTVWFVTAILVCYMIYPVLFLFFKKTNHSIWSLLFTLSFCLLLNYFIKMNFDPLWSHSEILFRRLPIFIIGSYVGKYVYEKRELPFTCTQAAVGSIIIAILYLYAMDQWRNNITTNRYDYIPFSIICTILFSVMGNINIFKVLFSFFGTITLEIYLSHENVLEIIPKLLPQANPVLINIASFVLAIVISVIVMKIGKLIFRKSPVLPAGDPNES